MSTNEMLKHIILREKKKTHFVLPGFHGFSWNPDNNFFLKTTCGILLLPKEGEAYVKYQYWRHPEWREQYIHKVPDRTTPYDEAPWVYLEVGRDYREILTTKMIPTCKKCLKVLGG